MQKNPTKLEKQGKKLKSIKIWFQQKDSNYSLGCQNTEQRLSIPCSVLLHISCLNSPNWKKSKQNQLSVIF